LKATFIEFAHPWKLELQAVPYKHSKLGCYIYLQEQLLQLQVLLEVV
jgi:hypothetical protein